MIPCKQNAGTGYFHWNAGAWFGGQIGCSAWLVTGAVWLFPQNPAVSAVWLACCAVVNSVGTVLWLNRTNLRMHPAVQILLAVSGVSGLVALYSATFIEPEAVHKMGWPGNGYWALFIIPAIMAWFAMMEWGSRKRVAP